jgi:outer membrane protein TolC
MAKRVTMKSRSFLLLLLFLHVLSSSFSKSAQANSSKPKKYLTPAEIESLVIENFPNIKNRLLEIEIEKDRREMLMGPLDPRLQGRYSDAEGYYNTVTQEYAVAKKFQFQGLELQGGFRQGVGNYPTYSDGETVSGGETFFKIELPLLRGRSIDNIRQSLRVADRGIQRSEQVYRTQSILVRSQALGAYWDLYRLLKVEEAIKSLLNVVVQRQEWIEKKARAGTLAKLVIKENEKSILLVRESLLEINNRIELVKNQLQLFLVSVNEAGPDFDIPQADLKSPPKINIALADISSWFKTHPFYLDLTYEIDQERTRLAFAKNNMLPDLNLHFEQVQPQNNGISSLSKTEEKAGINLRFPLFISEARGARGMAEKRLNFLENRREQVLRELKRDYQNALSTLERFEKQISILQKQVEIDTQLRSAEEVIFRQGSSNMINLNIRDRTLLESQVKYIDAEVQVRKLQIDILALQGKDRFISLD